MGKSVYVLLILLFGAIAVYTLAPDVCNQIISVLSPHDGGLLNNIIDFGL